MLSNSVHQRFSGLAIENRPFSGGRYFEPQAGRRLEKKCPADGRRLPFLFACDAQDVDQVVNDAERAYQVGHWRNLDVSEKQSVLRRWAAMIEAEIPYLAYLDALETGRAYRNFVEDSIPKALEALRWFTEAVDKFHAVHNRRSPLELSFISHEPLGVVGIITPWNDPLVIALWKTSPALLMGNSVVIKPAEQSSFSTIRIAELAVQAGLPEGIFNVVTGVGEVAGRALALHQKIRGIFFTGSSEVGKQILVGAGESNMKKVGLECGGKSAFIVSKHCDCLPLAAEALARSMFYNQGQICSAPSRLIVHREVSEEFYSLLFAEAQLYAPGDPFLENTLVGSLVGRDQYHRVQGYIELGLSAGYRYYQVGRREGLSDEDCFVQPIIFMDVPSDSPLARDEIFGPVLVTQEFDCLEQALALANDSPFGLAASIWTSNLDEALKVAQRLEVGVVHVNSYGDDDNTAPFGGVKESGIGRDKSLFAFQDYSNLKTTWIKLGAGGLA